MYIYNIPSFYQPQIPFFIGCDPSSAPWMAQPAPPSKSWDHDHCAKSFFAATAKRRDTTIAIGNIICNGLVSFSVCKYESPLKGAHMMIILRTERMEHPYA